MMRGLGKEKIDDAAELQLVESFPSVIGVG
jgi:hypothetical protein